MRSMLLGLAAIALLAGCTASAVSPDAGITISGKAIDTTGSPVVGAPVSLIRSSLNAVNNSCAGVIALSSTDTSTDSSGHYQFSLLGSDTQSGGNARCFEVRAFGGDGGPVAVADFPVQVDAVAVPDLQRWDAQLTANPGGAALGLTWRSPTTSLGANAALDGQTLTLAGPDGNAWSQSLDPTTSTASLPDTLREDWVVRAGLLAHGSPKGSGVVFSVSTVPTGLTLPRGALRPLSRGAACASPDATLPSPCPFTDGSLVVAPIGIAHLTVTLAAPAKARTLVLRGVTGGRDVAVESSVDGVAFTNVGGGSSGNGFALIDLSVPTAAATYRVTFRDLGQSTARSVNLAELSLFP